MRRGQAALEYIVTYGWAFLAIIVMIGGLSYFGIISPSKWVPEKCDFGDQLECADFQVNVNGNNNEFKLYLRNGFGKDITITGFKATTDTGTLTLGGGGSLLAGETKEFTWSGAQANLLREGAKQQIIIEITMRKTGPPLGAEHKIVGLIYGTAN